MPMHEPDASDPLELCGVRSDVEEHDLRFMAECLIEEFWRPGSTSQEVMALFRSPEYSLAHRAWLELGEVQVFAMVSEVAARRSIHA
jgi:hypothetical protein